MRLQSGNSSAGRAQPCQGWGREFESRFPLQIQKNPVIEPGFLCLVFSFRISFYLLPFLPV